MSNKGADIGEAVLSVFEFDNAAFFICLGRYLADHLNGVVSNVGYSRNTLGNSLNAKAINILNIDLHRCLRLDFPAFMHKRNVEKTRLIHTHRLNMLYSVRIHTFLKQFLLLEVTLVDLCQGLRHALNELNGFLIDLLSNKPRANGNLS